MVRLNRSRGAFFVRSSLKFTWLAEPDVEDLVHLRVVRRDVEHVIRLVLDARYVDRHQVLGDLLPAHRSRAARAHVEHLGPQSAK